MNFLFPLPRKPKRMSLSELRRKRDQAATKVIEMHTAALLKDYGDAATARAFGENMVAIDRLIQDPFHRNSRFWLLGKNDHNLNAADRERLKLELQFLALCERVYDEEHTALCPRPQQLELV